MAIVLTDFDKIWASSSPLTPYSFSTANYEEGWNFVGSTPPARQMWDGYMKWSDEKQQWIVNNFLPLSGGTMTGTIETSSSQAIKKTDNDNYIQFNSGIATADGSNLVMCAKGYSGGLGAGAFQLTARDSNTYKILYGKPDGTLTWDGKSIPDRSYGINLTSVDNTYTFNIVANASVIFAKRGGDCGVYMVTYWDSGSTKIFSSGTEPITITKSANSNSVTITDVAGTAVAIKIINGGAL